MKIFLSWSGPQSLQVAKLFKELLPLMNNDLDPFLSKHDIESGARWSARIASELENTDYGIIFITRSNKTKPWLLFEAGALTKHIEGRAAGLLLGELEPRDIEGPLSQFQHREFNQEGLAQLFEDITKHSKSKLDHNQASRVLEKWWSDFESGIEGIDFESTDNEVSSEPRDDGSVLNEILKRIRTLEKLSVSNKTTSSDLIGQTGAISLSASTSIVSSLLDLLENEQLTLLHNIALLKIKKDQEAIDQLLEDTEESLIDDLVSKGLLSRHPSKGVMMNRLLGETLISNFTLEEA